MVCTTTRQARTKSNLFRYSDPMLFNDQISIPPIFTYVTGFAQSFIKLCCLNWTALDCSILCRRQKHIDIAINYQKSRDGLHLLVDFTGLKFLDEGEWKRKKHQPEYRRQWRNFILV
jgi:hypothetical protein